MTTDYKNLLEQLLDEVIKQGASDLHFSEGRHPYIRLNGELIPMTSHEILDGVTTRGILNVMISEAFQKACVPFFLHSNPYVVTNNST